MTNYEKIKAMSVEEMADFICGIYDDDFSQDKHICGVWVEGSDEEAIQEYLESEAEEDG